jgi:hypothetical protein
MNQSGYSGIVTIRDVTINEVTKAISPGAKASTVNFKRL